ncbi:flavin reductase family protein [Winogradskya consettensis]|uniref:Monooxygenase n=1 Tax=Winogradskya consettensis TaxID=113560 RepID=A0A919SMZ4_9ACTN|nr:flavin reductase family protein [Actinoplanes consettensis]GIM74699.1 monooxygenase [Actinoplanes consettensis]
MAEIPIPSREFRRVLGGFASGVTVITAMVDGVPVGMTCQSFFSLSLDPPLVAFSPSRRSASYPLIRQSGSFCVNILEASQQALCEQFSRTGTDKWKGVSWTTGVTGSPLLEGALASIDCRLDQELETGDHYLTIGRVVELDAVEGREPLLFFNGGYERLCSTAA